jgi:hypothetical protein
LKNKWGEEMAIRNTNLTRPGKSLQIIIKY